MLLNQGELDGRQVLEASAVTEVLKPQVMVDATTYYPYIDLLAPNWMTYGFGWFQLDHAGRAVAIHTGSIGGMSAMAGLIPSQNLGVAIFVNLDHAEVRRALLWKAFDLFGGETADRDWSTDLKAIFDVRGE